MPHSCNEPIKFRPPPETGRVPKIDQLLGDANAPEAALEPAHEPQHPEPQQQAQEVGPAPGFEQALLIQIAIEENDAAEVPVEVSLLDNGPEDSADQEEQEQQLEAHQQQLLTEASAIGREEGADAPVLLPNVL